MSLSFLMCSERSGSNFITKLLNGHSFICGPSTKHIINPIARNLFRYEPLDQEKNWFELLKDINRLMTVDFSVWKKTFSLEELKELAPIGSISMLIENIFLEEAKANGKSKVFIKENHVYEFLPFLLLNYPDSKFVYQTRDPRDMALSWKKNKDHPGGVVKAARQWQKDQQSTLKNYSELKKINRAYFVRYEDLIENPKFYTKELVEFLGLTHEDDILDFHKDPLTQQNSGMQKAWGNLSKKVISDNKGKYLKELSGNEIKAIEKICFYEMIYLGYEPTFSKEELDCFNSDELSDLESNELKNTLFERAEDVINNMEAKKIFYQKVL